MNNDSNIITHAVDKSIELNKSYRDLKETEPFQENYQTEKTPWTVNIF